MALERREEGCNKQGKGKLYTQVRAATAGAHLQMRDLGVSLSSAAASEQLAATGKQKAVYDYQVRAGRARVHTQVEASCRVSLSSAARRALSVAGRAECQKVSTCPCTSKSASPSIASRGGLSFACDVHLQLQHV